MSATIRLMAVLVCASISPSLVVGSPQPVHSPPAINDAQVRGLVVRIGGSRMLHDGEPHLLRFSPDGRYFASLSASEHAVRIWEVATGRQRHLLKLPARARGGESLFFSRDGSKLIVCSLTGEDETLCTTWHVQSGNRLSIEEGVIRGAWIGFGITPDDQAVYAMDPLSDDDGPSSFRYAVGDRKRCDLFWPIPLLRVHAAIPLILVALCPPPERMFPDAICFSPDGSIVAIRGFRGNCLFDGRDGTCLHDLNRDGREEHPLAFSGDSTCLVTLGRGNGRLTLWNTKTGEVTCTLEIPDTGHDRGDAVLSHDGSRVISAGWGDGKVRVHDTKSGKQLRELDLPKCMRPLSLSPDGRLLAWIEGSWVRMWDIERGCPLHKESDWLSAPPDRLAFSSDARTLFLQDDTGAIRMFDARNGKPVGAIANRAAFQLAKDVLLGDPICPHSTERTPLQRRTHAAVASFYRCTAFTGTTAAPWPSTRAQIIDRSSSGTQLRRRGENGYSFYYLWNPQNPLRIGNLPYHGRDTIVSRFSGDGELLMTVAGVSCGSGPIIEGPEQDIWQAIDPFCCEKMGWVVRLFHCRSGEEVSLYHLEHGEARTDVRCLAIDGRRFAYSYSNNVVRVASFLNPKVCADIPLDTHLPFDHSEEGIGAEQWPVHSSILLSRDGRLLAVTCADELRNWSTACIVEIASGERRFVLPVEPGYVRSFAFSPDGRRLATGNADTTITIWDLEALAPSLESKRSLDELWTDLSHDNAAEAWQAMQSLIARPKDAVTLLRERLRPVVVDEKRFYRLVAELDDNSFRIRAAAHSQLADLEEAIEDRLQALLPAPTAEVHTRIERLLQSMHKLPMNGIQRRATRAIEVLERIDSTKSRELLGELAAGDVKARRTQEARLILGRLQKK